MRRIVALLAVFLVQQIDLDPSLPSYNIDPGRKPSWSTKSEEELQLTRWGIDTKTSNCVSFIYRGSGGNFNNFPTKQACENHKIFKPVEQISACLLPPDVGRCTEVPENKRIERWYFSNEGNSQGSTEVAPNTCGAFLYTGCGGNANNFRSELECRKVCQNNVSGAAPEDGNKDKSNELLVPNEFDCRFYEPPDSSEPIVRIVADIDNKRCIFAATSASKVKRGYFTSLAQCVSTCFENNYVEACSKPGPEQFDLPPAPDFTTITTKIKYYFDNAAKICKRFETFVPKNTKFSPTKNCFDSLELCSSYCPAVSQPLMIKATMPCNEDPKAGEYVENGTNGNLQIERYTYDITSNSCSKFVFGGINGNSNNFLTQEECDLVCTSV